MRWFRLLTLLTVVLGISGISARLPAQTASSKKAKAPTSAVSSGIESGTVINGVYRNKSLGLECRIPEGWVLRTQEMNSPEQGEARHPMQDSSSQQKSSPPKAHGGTEESKVLLVAFSRPPEARGEDVNASIVIAAEPILSYPGMTDAAQYFGPLTGVANAQGFTVDEEPYEFAIGMKKLVRGDFHKDVGTRVMRQSTLAFLARGYAVSITVIGGTEDEVEELIDGVAFTSGK